MDTDDGIPHRLHGTLPLIIDGESGKLRFAEIGPDLGRYCLTGPEGLPDAEIDLIVFHNSNDMRMWCKGLEYIAGNTVETVFPPVNHPKFLLVIRHDRPRRKGQTLEDVITLKGVTPQPTGVDPAALGREAIQRITSRWNRVLAMETFENEWMTETATIARTEGFSVDRHHSAEEGRLCFQYDAPSEIAGMGPRFSAVKAEEGYEVTWPLMEFFIRAEAFARVDDEAAARGLSRQDRYISCRVPAIDAEWLQFLARSAESLEDAAQTRREDLAQSEGRPITGP